jgi:hypothetical protein
VNSWFSHARRPRRCCSAAADLRALTASIALISVVVLVGLGQPLLPVAGVVFVVLSLVLGAPPRAKAGLLGRGRPVGSGAV